MTHIMPQIDWVYPAHADYNTVRVKGPFVDGDTFIVERLLNQQGLKESEVWVRLLEVNTAEVTGDTKEAGLIAAAWTKDWLETASNTASGASLAYAKWPLAIQTLKKDSFGRHLAYIWNRTTGECLNDAIIEAGLSERISALMQLKAAGTFPGGAI